MRAIDRLARDGDDPSGTPPEPEPEAPASDPWRDLPPSPDEPRG